MGKERQADRRDSEADEQHVHRADPRGNGRDERGGDKEGEAADGGVEAVEEGAVARALDFERQQRQRQAQSDGGAEHAGIGRREAEPALVRGVIGSGHAPEWVAGLGAEGEGGDRCPSQFAPVRKPALPNARSDGERREHVRWRVKPSSNGDLLVYRPCCPRLPPYWRRAST